MPKKLLYTPNSQIKSALRMLFMRSRERAAALKRDDRTCQKCGAKASVAKDRVVKVEIHHLKRIENWDRIYADVREGLLCDPSGMTTLCKQCHDGLPAIKEEGK